MNISYSYFPAESLNICHYKSSLRYCDPFIEKKALLAAAFISHMYTHFQRIFFGSCHFIIQKYMEGHACHIITQENLGSAHRQKMHTCNFQLFIFKFRCYQSQFIFQLLYDNVNSGMKFMSGVANGFFVSILVSSIQQQFLKFKKTKEKDIPKASASLLFVCLSCHSH